MSRFAFSLMIDFKEVALFAQIPHGKPVQRMAAVLVCLVIACATSFAVGPPVGTTNWELQSPTVHPSARNGHAMADLPDNQVLLFGGGEGALEDNIPAPAETWVYDPTSDEWTLMNPATQPDARSYHAMARIDGDQILLFGGIDWSFDEAFYETWVYDLSENTWTSMEPGPAPQAVVASAMANLPGDRVLLFGGALDAVEMSSETWIYDLSDNAWTQLFPVQSPSARCFHAMAPITDEWIILFGGEDQLYWGDFVAGDTWLFDDDDGSWNLLFPEGDPGDPWARAFHSMAQLDETRLLLFGGDSDAGITNETWILEVEEDWELQTPATAPSERGIMALANCGDSLAMLFGGLPEGDEEDDTWIFRAARAGITVTPTESLETAEDGSTASFEVSADLAPNEPVDVPLISSDTTEGTTPDFVTLPAGSTDPVTVTVTGVDDAIVDGDIVYTIETGDPESDDAEYDALGADDVQDVEVTNLDMDSPRLEVEGDNERIQNGDSTPSRTDDTDLGAVAVGDSTSSDFEIHNRSDVELQLTGNPMVQLTGSGNFSVSQPRRTTIQPGESEEFTVSCSPSGLGERTAIVSIRSNDPNDDPFEFEVACTGGSAPEIVVSGNGRDIPYEDDAPTNSKGTIFQLVDAVTVTRTFSIKNEGNEVLLLHNLPNHVTVDHGQFSISDQPDTALDPGESTTFSLTFTAGAESFVLATVSVWNSDNDQDPFTFMVQGSTPGAAPPTLQADAGPDQIVLIGDRVFLDGTASFDGTATAASMQPQVRPMAITNYAWEFAVDRYVANSPVLAIPTGSRCRETMSGFNTATPSFVADMAGTYTLELEITNSDGETTTDRVIITAVLEFVDPPTLEIDAPTWYPSPFSDEVVFGFLGEGTPDSIVVSIYNLMGERVWQAVATHEPSITWDGISQDGLRLPNGPYIASLTVRGNGEIHTRTALLFIYR